MLIDKRHSFKKKKATATDYVYQKDESTVQQKIFVDSQWKQSMDNLWLLGDNAILAVDIIPRPATADTAMLPLLTRRMILGTEQSYPDLDRLAITTANNQTRISNLHYKPTTQSVTQDFKILTTLSDGSVAFFTLTVFNGAYVKNKDYFQKILDSYRVEQ